MQIIPPVNVFKKIKVWNNLNENIKTRMTTFIKTKQQIRWSHEYWQYRVAANITEYQNDLQKCM